MKRKRELTGWHVLAMLVAFFGMMVVANAVFVTVAVRSFPGETEPHAYLSGLAYNDVLAERAVQTALGWRAELTRVESTDNESVIELRLYDRSGAPLTGLTTGGVIKRPADDDADQEIAFEETAPGVYAARMSRLMAGAWAFEAQAETRRGERLDIRSRIIAP